MACGDDNGYISGVPVRVETDPHAENASAHSRTLWILKPDGTLAQISATTSLGDDPVTVLVCPMGFIPTAADFENPSPGCWRGSASDITMHGRQGRAAKLDHARIREMSDEERAAMIGTFQQNMRGPKVRDGHLRQKLSELGVPYKPPHGYVYSKQTKVLADAIAARLSEGKLTVGLLEGPPGTGKTALAEALVAEFGEGARLFEYRCHSDSDQDIISDIDTNAAVRGEGAVLPGPALEAFEWSARGGTDGTGGVAVLLIDELDKAPRRFEDDILRLVETGRAKANTRSGENLPFQMDEDGWVRAEVGNLVVMFTTNGTRGVSAPLQRRTTGVRARLEYPSAREQVERITSLYETRTGEPAPAGLVNLSVRLGGAVRSQMKSEIEKNDLAPTVQELTSIVETLVSMDRAGNLDADAAFDIAASMLIKSTGDAIDYGDKVAGMLKGAVSDGTLRWSSGTGGSSSVAFESEVKKWSRTQVLEELQVLQNRAHTLNDADRIHELARSVARGVDPDKLTDARRFIVTRRFELRSEKSPSSSFSIESVGRALAGEARAASKTRKTSQKPSNK